MKKLLLVLLVLFAKTNMLAQLSFEGSKEYGRIMDVTYHPENENRLYASTMGNHIVTSADNGKNWTLLYTYPIKYNIINGLKFQQGNALSFTASISNSNTNKLFILDLNTLTISKEYSIPIPTGSEESSITSYSIVQGNTDIALIQQYFNIGGALKTKVYYTNNGGAVWDEVYYSADSDAIGSWQVAISPNNAQKLYITRSPDHDPAVFGGLLISTNAGATWEEKLPGIKLNPIAISPANPDTILVGTLEYGETQNLYRSTDGGENWNLITPDWADLMPGGVNIIRFNPGDANNILVFGRYEIIRTKDNFATWDVYEFPADMNNPENYFYGTNASFNPHNQNEVFISANDYALFSDDGGQTVSKVDNTFFLTTGSVNFFSDTDQSHLYYGVQSGLMHKDMVTLNETSQFTLPLQFFSYLNNSYFIDSYVPGRTYFYSGTFEGSSLSVSNNHGVINLSIPIPLPFLHAAAANPSNPNIFWISLSNDYVSSVLKTVDISNPENVIMTSISLPVPGLVTAIEIDPANPAKKIITLDTHVYKTLDNGNTWQQMDAGLEILSPVNDLIFQISRNPLNANQLTIATTKGIYTSYNDGATWVQVSTFHVHNVKQSTKTPGHMAAITHDSAVAEFALRFSADYGANWTTISNETLHHIGCSAGAFDFSEDTVDAYLGSFDIGLIKYTFDFSTMGTPGIQDPAKWITLYPNPVNDILNLQLENETLEDVSIYTITGQKIMESKESVLNVSMLQDGIYIIDISTVSGKKATKKFSKN